MNVSPTFFTRVGKLVSAMDERVDSVRQDWRDIKDYLLPWHGRNLNGWDTESEVDDGTQKRELIFSQIPEDSINRLSAGLQNSLTPRAEPWFSLSVEDQALQSRYVVQQYLYEVERRMRVVFSKSNFYDVLAHVYTELVGFGTAAMAMLEDEETITRFKPFTAGEYLIATNSRGLVNVFYRETWMTVSQVVEKFGIENVSEEVAMKANDKDQTQTKLKVCQLVETNTGEVKSFSLLKEHGFRSVYWEKNKSNVENKVLEIKGYYEFPVMVVRWSVVGDDVWGRSPSMKIMPDVKSLYKISENSLIALDKLLDPPIVAPGTMKNEYVDNFPGGITFSDDLTGQDSLKPLYQIRPDLKSAEYMKEQLGAAIQRGLFNDIFLMLANTPDTKRMTATEVMGRREEKMTMLGPVLGRLQGELLSQVIDREFAMMSRVGALPEAPPELRGRELKIEYLSILAKAQEMGSVNAMNQFLNFVGTIAQAKPEALDKLNADGMIDEFVEKTGVPPTAVVPEEQVTAIRKQRAEQQAQAQQMAMMQASANIAQTAGKTPMGDSTVLDKTVEAANEQQ